MIRATLCRALAALLVLAGAACAARPDAVDTASDVNDPAEPANRGIFAANMFIDRHAVKPVAQAYHDWLPQPVRDGVHNMVTNLGEPVVLVNDLLQANPGPAWVTARRFVINSTAGGLGVFDLAADWDLPHHKADFGQTFGVWGIGEGPFVELPLLGPSNARDAVGTAFTFLASPFNYFGGAAVTYVGYAKVGVETVDQRAGVLAPLDELERNSVDFYAALRSLNHQRREALIAEGKSPGGHTGHIEVIPRIDAPDDGPETKEPDK